MRSKAEYSLVLVTAPDHKTARNLARLALEARLIACANIIRNVESHYWWKGNIETSAEVILLMKTTSKAVPNLEGLVLANHPYETPEFVVLPILRGNEKYMQWILDAVQV